MPTLLKEELINILNLSKTNKDEYNYFVETGTYMGETILRFMDDFEKLYTIELSNHFYEDFNKKNYNRDKLKSILGDSSEKIKEVIDELNGKTIFFLDGHYSSCGTAQGVKDVPLCEELKSIYNYFNYESIIIIDDLRLFGTKINEDWSEITKEKMMDILTDRVDFNLEVGDRLIIKLKQK
jgi:hypothetical protein